MKKIIIALGAILLLVVGYNMWGNNIPETNGETAADESLGTGIKKSISGIMPGKSENDQKLETHDKNDPHIVVINSRPVHMEVEDAIEKIEASKSLGEREAFDFARWTLTSENAKYTPEEKERILERSIEILNPDEAGLLTRDLLFSVKEPDLISPAMNHQSQVLKREDFEDLIREVLKLRAEPEIRSAVIEFAATKNIYVK
jgi:hypothetical protein